MASLAALRFALQMLMLDRVPRREPDRTAALQQCRLPRIARIEGRTADVFWVRDDAVYRQVQGEVFKHALDSAREVREWQAVQEDRNRVRVRLELIPGVAFDPERAHRMLGRQLELFDLGGLLEIDLEPVPALAADPHTAKFRRLVSLVGPPAGYDGEDAPACEIAGSASPAVGRSI
jgi:phenylacetate-coenzyme A ligase PaaK-like adenylate-forming protein